MKFLISVRVLTVEDEILEHDVEDKILEPSYHLMILIRISLDNIIRNARDDRKYQFIFLTPLNTDGIEVGSSFKIKI